MYGSGLTGQTIYPYQSIDFHYMLYPYHMINLESLRCFEIAATELNFRKSARRVHLSPAAFGERIRSLEELLDAKLFERTTRKITLSSAGIRLLPQARRTLAEAQKCLHVLDEDSDTKPSYELTVGTRFELGMSWLVPNLNGLNKLSPERRLHLYFGDSPDLFLRLERDEIDAMVSSVRITSTKFASAPLHEEEYNFVASPKLLKALPLTRADHAAEHVLLDAHRDLPLFSYFLDAAPSDQLWAFKKTEYLGAIGAIRLRALDHVGVAVLPRYFIAEDLAHKRLVQVMPKIRLQPDIFRLIWRRRQTKAELLYNFADELVQFPLQ
jgi:LysR family transcriptional regulator, glycine cleavage system transcriptional activator